MPKSLSIRSRIGLLLSILVIVIVYMSYSRITYLREKEQEFLSATDRSRASFELVNDLRLTSLRLQELADSVVGETDPRALSEAEAASKRIFSATRAVIGRASGKVETSPQNTLNLESLERGFEAAVAGRRGFLDANEEFNRKRAELATTLDLLQAQLNRMNVVIRQVEPDARADGMGLEQVEAGIRLRIKLSALLDRSRSLASVRDAKDVRASISELLPVLGEVLRALSVVSNVQETGEVLDLISRLRKNIQGESGLQAASDVAVASLAQSRDASAALKGLLKTSGKTLDALVSVTEAEIYNVFDETAKASRRAILSELLLSWGAALGLVLAVWLVFHRQISQRIVWLSEDVTRIASGDVDSPATVTGKDEIGQMAEALEVFRKNARALNRSNEQLRNFTYVASHDLRSPLRAIRDLVDWTIEDAGDGLPDVVSENLALIKDRSERLSQLLNDLLTYARADYSESVPENVDLLQLTKTIAELADPSQRFHVTYRGLRRAATYKAPLQTILLNLVANAIAHHDMDSGTISIVGRKRGRHLELEVRDDGPGIATQYQERIFEMFQTLGSPEGARGNGMGLALVRKLVHGMDGTVTIASNPSERRGATFTLHIPMERNTETYTNKDSTLPLGDAA